MSNDYSLPADLVSGGPSPHAFLQALIDIVGATNAQTQTISATIAAGGSNKSIQYNNGGTFGGIGPLSNGQLPIGSTGAVSVAGSLTAPIAGLIITSGPGTITFALADDLAALEGLIGLGFVSRIASETYAERTITGTSNRIVTTNGDGIAGNPTIDIDTAYAGQATITTLGTIATGVWHGTAVGVQYGGTGSNLSATGGASQVLKQTSVGGAVTVAQLAASDLSNGTTGSGSVVLAAAPALTGVVTIGGTGATVPALKRSTTTLQVRLGDDSAFTNLQGKLTTETNYTVTAPAATGYLTLYDATGTSYKVLCST